MANVEDTHEDTPITCDYLSRIANEAKSELQKEYKKKRDLDISAAINLILPACKIAAEKGHDYDVFQFGSQNATRHAPNAIAFCRDVSDVRNIATVLTATYNFHCHVAPPDDQDPWTELTVRWIKP